MNAKSGEKKLVGGESGAKKLFDSSFFKTGGSLLYCLSALSIIWGLSQIITPIFMKGNLLWEKVLCIGAMNLYEFALIAVLLVLVLWKGVKDDAVSLVVISALFFVAGGILVDTIANDSSTFSTVIGGLVFLFSGLKIFTLRSYVGIKFKALILAGLGMILFWNFFISSWMANVLEAETELPITIWRYGWILMLSGIVMMVLQAIIDRPIAAPVENESDTQDPSELALQSEDPLKDMKEQILHQGEEVEAEVVPVVDRKPFLNSKGMVWVFLGELLCAGAVHQYVLSYIFDIRMVFGDFIPLFAILCFLIIELFWNYRKEGKLDVILTFVPLVLIFIGKISGSLVDVSSPGGIIWNPGFITLAVLFWVVLLALRKREKKFIYPAAAYLITVMLFGFTMTQEPMTMASINWELPVLLLLIATFIAGFYYKIPALSLVSVILAGVGFVSLQRVDMFFARYHISQAGAGMMLTGLGILAVYLLLKRITHVSIAITGAVIFAIGILNLSISQPSIGRLIILAFASVSVSFVMWLFTRDKAITAIIGAPILYHTYYSITNMNGWHFVLLSFLLLSAGFAISMLKQNQSLDFSHKDLSKGGVK